MLYNRQTKQRRKIMLTIEKPSPISNKLVIATLVFSVGFIGSLSVLGVFHPSLGQLSSSWSSTTASRSDSLPPDKAQADFDTIVNDDAITTNSASGEIKPAVSTPADSPASSFSDQTPAPNQLSSSGVVHISGEMPVITSQPASTASVPATVTQPSTSTPDESVAPIPSLTQPFTDTGGSLLPSF